MKDHRRTDAALVTSQLSYGALVGDFAVQGTWYLAVLGISEHSFIAAVLRYRVFDTQRNFVIYLHARHKLKDFKLAQKMGQLGRFFKNTQKVVTRHCNKHSFDSTRLYDHWRFYERFFERFYACFYD